jgi:uncharacterized protein (DUF433 family)
MKNYRLDPKNLPQLTPEEARRLDKARIDYSDIPPLGDEFFTRARAMPNRETIEAMKAAERGEVTTVGHPTKLLKSLNADRLDEIDWSQCPDVESVPDRCHGAPVVKGTRVMVQAIIDNAEAGCSAEQIAREIYDLDLNVVRRVLRFAYNSEIAAIIGPARPAPPLSTKAQARLDTLICKVLALRHTIPKDQLTAADIDPYGPRG